MAINLEKGQKINLEKADGSSLQQIFLGVGWDVAKSKGLFGFGGSSGDIDLDASVILFDENKQVVDVVYFGPPRPLGGPGRRPHLHHLRRDLPPLPAPRTGPRRLPALVADPLLDDGRASPSGPGHRSRSVHGRCR